MSAPVVPDPALDKTSQEPALKVGTVNARSQCIGHAPAHHHVARDLGGAFEIVGGAGGHLVHEYFFGDTPAHQHRDHRLQSTAVVAVAIAAPLVAAWFTRSRVYSPASVAKLLEGQAAAAPIPPGAATARWPDAHA